MTTLTKKAPYVRPVGSSSVAPHPAAEIVVCGRFLSQRVTGVQRYAREIVKRLRGCQVVAPEHGGQGIRGHLWEQAALPGQVGRRLLWSPCNTGPLAVRNQVLTLHDASVFDCPDCFSPVFGAWNRWLVRRLAHQVRHLITVSEFSRKRIVDICRIAPDRITVIPNGVDDRFAPASPDDTARVRARYALHRDYVLAVGSLEPRKNLARLLQAWTLVYPAFPDVELVIAGGRAAIYGKALSAAAEQQSRGTRWLGYVPDDLLPALYGSAAAVAYPSLYEGFGLPVLEAMACGTPVVTSNLSALPEVAGDAAELVDPTDCDSIAAGIRRVLESESLRRQLSGAGVQRAKQYSWDQIARTTLDLLVDLASKS